jgi:hypothetical protein
VTVAARADAPTVLEARRAAIEAGAAALKAAIGRDSPDPETIKFSAVRLPDGRYRGFILVAASE